MFATYEGVISRVDKVSEKEDVNEENSDEDEEQSNKVQTNEKLRLQAAIQNAEEVDNLRQEQLKDEDSDLEEIVAPKDFVRSQRSTWVARRYSSLWTRGLIYVPATTVVPEIKVDPFNLPPGEFLAYA